MQSTKKKDARIIYLAGSAREFPEEVQEWLGQVDNRAVASPNVYDTLALLAMGRKPAAIIVSMDMIDWNEMEFFDQAKRLSQETHIYVTGHKHHDEKIEAARARGARPFDTNALNDDLSTAVKSPKSGKASTPEELLAGSLRPTGSALKPPPVESIPQRSDIDRSDAESMPAETSPVRLVAPSEEDEDADEWGGLVPFPWAPSPKLPKRTPPKSPSSTNDATTASDSIPTITNAEKSRETPTIRLTPEELAALRGKSVTPNSGSAKEQQQ